MLRLVPPSPLPKPGTPAALALACQARRTPPMRRDPLQLCLAAAFKRDSDALAALVQRGETYKQHVGYALNVYAEEFGRSLTGASEAA